MDLTLPANHRVKMKKKTKQKIKQNKKKDKYLDLTRKLKKMWNMKMTVIPIVICALDTVTKGLVHGLEILKITGRVETI